MPRTTGSVDYLLIGHVCLDEHDGGETLGGTVTFAARAARALGFRPGIVTACPDPSSIRAALPDVPLAVQSSPEWTRFRNDYVDVIRWQSSRTQADPIGPGVIPREWLESARIVHLAPVANEIRPLPDLRRPGRIVGLTAQGLLRQLGPGTLVRAADPHLTHRELLMLDAIVVSREDVAALPSLPRTWADFVPLVVVTLAEAGAMYLETGRRFRDVPTRPVPSTSPTGAGDLFAAALFAALLVGQKPRAAIDAANRFVGTVLELRSSESEDQALRQAAANSSFVTRTPAAG